jgi:hypothetical protein
MNKCDTCSTDVDDGFIRCDTCENAFIKKYPFLDGIPGMIFGTLLGSTMVALMFLAFVRFYE